MMPVAALLRSRAENPTPRKERQDPFHLALVIEGGGMRGVVTGGMVTAIEELGLLHCFDTIHGSSAGACAGVYLTAGQAALGTSIYFEDINNAKFISLCRGLRGGATMSADFLIDRVMRVEKPLNYQAVLGEHGFLHIVTTSVHTAAARVFSSWSNASALFTALKASILIPVIAGGSIAVDGEALVDGGVVQPLAVDSAVAAGATHILALLSRRRGELERKSSPIVYLLERTMLMRRYGAPIATAYETRHSQLNVVLQALQSGGIARGITCAAVVRAANATLVGILTKDAKLLRAGAEEGRQAVTEFFDPSVRRNRTPTAHTGFVC
jgi:predicted patatin/cPLA2 family phospholipase